MDKSKLTCKHNPRIRIWAGWYEIHQYYYDGVYIGSIQVKRQYKRTSIHSNSAVGMYGIMGGDVDWLYKDAKENGLIAK